MTHKKNNKNGIKIKNRIGEVSATGKTARILGFFIGLSILLLSIIYALNFLFE